jgi:hypothetical protein
LDPWSGKYKGSQNFVYCDASAPCRTILQSCGFFLMVLFRCLIRNPVYPHRHNLSNRMDYVSKIKKMGTTVFLKVLKEMLTKIEGFETETLYIPVKASLSE